MILHIIKAFAYLHSCSPPILHRDLKPENILIKNKRLIIADFGWSNRANPGRNTYCGTPEYLSPEMILGTKQTTKLDIWTIGILMYELLTGKSPFQADKNLKNKRLIVRQIEKKILDGAIDFSDISSEAKEIIKAMLNPNPELRPSACELLEFSFFDKKVRK